MRAPLPRRDWRKVVAATQGITLTIAAAGVVPPILMQVALAGALALLAESFGRDVWWLWRNRHADRSAQAVPTRDRRPRGGRAHGARPPGRVGRARGPEPAQASHTGRVREGPARGHRRHRAGPRPAGDRTSPPGLGGRPRARPPGHREAARLRLLHRLRPAVQPHRRLEVHVDRHRDAPRLDRPHRRQPRAGRSGAPHRRGARPPDPGGASPDRGRSPPPPVVAPGGGGPRRRVGALLGVRRGARLRRPHRLHERRRSGDPGGTRGAGRPARSSAVRARDPPTTATATRLAAGS